jgi:hypothetical protein
LLVALVELELAYRQILLRLVLLRTLALQVRFQTRLRQSHLVLELRLEYRNPLVRHQILLEVC